MRIKEPPSKDRQRNRAGSDKDLHKKGEINKHREKVTQAGDAYLQGPGVSAEWCLNQYIDQAWVLRPSAACFGPGSGPAPALRPGIFITQRCVCPGVVQANSFHLKMQKQTALYFNNTCLMNLLAPPFTERLLFEMLPTSFPVLRPAQSLIPGLWPSCHRGAPKPKSMA